MAAGWGVTTNSQSIEYTYNWAIENFDFNMGAHGKIESGKFTIPGVTGELSLVVANECHGRVQNVPIKLKAGGKVFDAENFFSVALKLTFSDMAKELEIPLGQGVKAIGKLEVIKEGAKAQLGENYIMDFDMKYVNYFWPNIASIQSSSSSIPTSGFYTQGSTSLLKLVAKIKIPGELTNRGGTDDAEEKMLFDFKPLLSDPKHSDIVLKCNGKEFPCHRVILAARSAVFDRMLEQNMVEAQKGVVDIIDVDPDTLWQMLEFVYTGQVKDEEYTAELLYAADKYELNSLVKLCAGQLRSKITTETAIDILLLADRHGLAQLKQDVMAKIVAEKAKYLANPEFKKKMTKNMLMEIFAQ